MHPFFYWATFRASPVNARAPVVSVRIVESIADFRYQHFCWAAIFVIEVLHGQTAVYISVIILIIKRSFLNSIYRRPTFLAGPPLDKQPISSFIPRSKTAASLYHQWFSRMFSYRYFARLVAAVIVSIGRICHRQTIVKAVLVITVICS